MPHTAQALIVQCIDYRFQSALRRFLLSQGLKDKYDLASLAGSAKDLSGKDKSFILKQIEISVRLHGIKKVYLIHHLDCGAYGGSKAFKDLKTEIGCHKFDLLQAKKIINKKFPYLKVKLAFAYFIGKKIRIILV